MRKLRWLEGAPFALLLGVWMALVPSATAAGVEGNQALDVQAVGTKTRETKSGAVQTKAAKPKNAKNQDAPPKAAKASTASRYCPPLDATGGAKPCYRYQARGPYGRCEPQSLPYARCRTGIMRCQGNCETSPIGWFACEQKLGKTSQRPESQSVLILGDNSRHRMSTGHVFVVENARDLGHGQWELTLSHTNHDRKCAIETDVRGIYDEQNRVLAMKSGAWSPWGKRLMALGFILR